MYNKKVILTTVGIVILLAAIVYVCSRISPLIGNYSVEKNEKKVEAKPTMDTKSQETKLKTTKPQATKKPRAKSLREILRFHRKVLIRIGICKEVVKLNLRRGQVFMMNGEMFRR